MRNFDLFGEYFLLHFYYRWKAICKYCFYALIEKEGAGPKRGILYELNSKNE